MSRDSLGRFVKGSKIGKEYWFKSGCGGEKHTCWKGGRTKNAAGYVLVYCPNHPRSCKNRIYEHILVAEKNIGRFLYPGEVVHHINGIKDDNRKENIVVLKNNSFHTKLFHPPKKKFIISKERLIELLETKNPLEISKILSVHFATVYRRMKEFKIVPKRKKHRLENIG